MCADSHTHTIFTVRETEKESQLVCACWIFEFILRFPYTYTVQCVQCTWLCGPITGISSKLWKSILTQGEYEMSPTLGAVEHNTCQSHGMESAPIKFLGKSNIHIHTFTLTQTSGNIWKRLANNYTYFSHNGSNHTWNWNHYWERARERRRETEIKEKIWNLLQIFLSTYSNRKNGNTDKNSSQIHCIRTSIPFSKFDRIFIFIN